MGAPARGLRDPPDARYPLAIFHGHFPSEFDAFSAEPPDLSTPCEYSARFRVDCYNHTVDSAKYALYQEWISPNFPRHLVVEIQHPTPYYDDSYAVNTEAQGPWGDAIMKELIPEVERRYRGIGEGWARFTYGGSTGGWEAMAAQVFYPDDFNGAWIACPDPIDFRAYGTVNVYDDKNAYHLDEPFKRTPRPSDRDWLGHVGATVEESNRWELVLGTHSRSGGQWDIWEATFSPVDSLGYPARIWDKVTGEIDPDVASYWRDNFDLTHIVQRDWATLGAEAGGQAAHLRGRHGQLLPERRGLHAQDVLESLTDPAYGGRGGLRRPGGALLERRSHAAQRHVPAALHPDVRPAHGGADDEEPSARRGPEELALLRTGCGAAAPCRAASAPDAHAARGTSVVRTFRVSNGISTPAAARASNTCSRSSKRAATCVFSSASQAWSSIATL